MLCNTYIQDSYRDISLLPPVQRDMCPTGLSTRLPVTLGGQPPWPVGQHELQLWHLAAAPSARLCALRPLLPGADLRIPAGSAERLAEIAAHQVSSNSRQHLWRRLDSPSCRLVPYHLDSTCDLWAGLDANEGAETIQLHSLTHHTSAH